MRKQLAIPSLAAGLATVVLLVGGPGMSAVQAQEARPTQESLTRAYSDTAPAKASEDYSPALSRTYPTTVYWGDTHVHTELSMDAGAFGARLKPADAYKFALGQEVTTATGQHAQLSRPLDFLVVSDHSDNMGWFEQLLAGNEKILSNPQGQEWYDAVTSGDPDRATAAALDIIDQFSRQTMDKDMMFFPTDPFYDEAWLATIEAAESFNDPGSFTAFIGYEWTSQEPPGQNLHRVVVYRDGADKAKETLPFTTYPPPPEGEYPPVSNMPERLWDAMQAYVDVTGGSLLAIPHNGNLSNGWMFPEGTLYPDEQPEGAPVDQHYVETRAKWEPLYEVTQIKGDGEAHPVLSPDDHFANYGTWDEGNLNLSEGKEDEMLQGEYARSALLTGLQLEAEYGTNPYKFGMIGSTDSHTALATADEDNFFGKHAGYEPSAERWEHVMTQSEDGTLKVNGWEQLASGYAAVWAMGNTREQLFDAMQRKEVYATTGTRPVVRFFGGWNYTPGQANSSDFVQIGYENGVPMGSDLPPLEFSHHVPKFLVSAAMDPDGAFLDRVQIVKGWLELDTGERKERVYDVAVSGNRTIDGEGRCLEAVGGGRIDEEGFVDYGTVDLEIATWTNTIGAPLFNVYWEDPDFHWRERAFYYARVIEIPTPRWTNYDAVRFGIDDMPDEIKVSQERAYTAPIWFLPPATVPQAKSNSGPGS